MVEVSLYQLVLVRGTRHLWPDWFRAGAEAIELAPHDRGSFAILADKCEEEGETELADVLRWFINNEKCGLKKDFRYLSGFSNTVTWSVNDFPRVLREFEDDLNSTRIDQSAVNDSAIYRVAVVGNVIKEVKSQL